jgi:haloalkane dehalogenase
MEAARPCSRGRGGEHGFVADGQGETVICVHGVPTSRFLYRKLLPELASRGLEGVTLDLPGLGLAGRPADFNYTWSG